MFDAVANVAFVRVKSAESASAPAAAGSNKRRRDEDAPSAAAVLTGYVAVNCAGKAPADVLKDLIAENLSLGGQVRLAGLSALCDSSTCWLRNHIILVFLVLMQS